MALEKASLSKSCRKKVSELPEIAILSSEILGGKSGGTLRTFYSGTVPPYFLKYRDGTIIYASNIGQKENPFYLYRCLRLSSEEQKDFYETVALKAEIPEPFGQFGVRSDLKNPGMTQVFYFHPDKTCGQFEIRGRMEDAETLSRGVRSSVVQKIPSSVYDLFRYIETLKQKLSIPWQPTRALVRLQKIGSYSGNTKAWDPAFKIRPLRKKSEHRYRNDYYYTVPVPPEKFRDFLKLFSSPVTYSGDTYAASYRMIFPGQRYWAGLFPTVDSENSICNRYVGHLNYWLMYGTSAQN